MPKFDKDNYSELKQYLNYILSEKNTDIILDSIVNNDTDILWNYVVGYKLIAHNLERLTIDDPELAFLVGKFLGNYAAVEKLHKRFEDKKTFNNNLDIVIASSDNALDILTDLYMAPAIGYNSMSLKYKNNLDKELKIMTKEKIVEKIEKEKENYYMLSKESRRFMKEHYFSNMGEEEKKEEKELDSLRSKTLYLLRENNKKEDL